MSTRQDPQVTDGPKPRIVVVEDEVATRRLVQRQLELAGYEVDVCGDGRAALAPISAMGTGIVLADWSMPEMDGLELCRAVRELEQMGALSHVYFILLTAHDSKERIVEGLDAGANDYLTKPYHQGELLARLHVGERMLALQAELLHRTVEYQKANAQLALLSRKLEESANTDALTGLANRRCLFDRFDGTWALAERLNQPLSCIMFDVDKFKRVNDTYGHYVGDQVLQEIARVASETSRRPDLCARIGGEEFAVLCPATARDDAAVLAERIRKNIAAAKVDCGEVELSVTVSCGVAERTPETGSPTELLNKADEMLYAAKQNGRNQTRVLDEDGASRRVADAAPVA